ncbi:hypothetical protein OHB12_02570 [Nocardia sp. NBC_01730]|uniref:hypothetical protein n=1 Tax=Nocardia sp. NBC_01730 TaxID=2975998 RepID=UPI002E0F04C2|nr:hypothetical protein OHB12_02570 [Nocardia sp. NBC_01730]
MAPGYIWADSVKFYFAYLAQERAVSPEQVYDEVAAGLKHFVEAAWTPARFLASSVLAPQRIRRYFDRRSAADDSGPLTASRIVFSRSVGSPGIAPR